MRIISALIFAVAMCGFQFGMYQNIHRAIKKEALAKVNSGINSLSNFSNKLTYN